MFDANLTSTKSAAGFCVGLDGATTANEQLCSNGPAIIGTLTSPSHPTRRLLLLALAAGSKAAAEPASIPVCDLEFLTTPDVNGIEIWACETDAIDVNIWFTAPDGTRVLASITPNR